MLHCLFQGFVKLTGWLPQWLIFRTKTTFEDRSVQGRGIRGKAIVVSNHNSIWDFAVLLYAFPFRTLRCAAAASLGHAAFFPAKVIVVNVFCKEKS